MIDFQNLVPTDIATLDVLGVDFDLLHSTIENHRAGSDKLFLGNTILQKTEETLSYRTQHVGGSDAVHPRIIPIYKKIKGMWRQLGRIQPLCVFESLEFIPNQEDRLPFDWFEVQEIAVAWQEPGDEHESRKKCSQTIIWPTWPIEWEKAWRIVRDRLNREHTAAEIAHIAGHCKISLVNAWRQD